ncbi:MAG: methyl-accepting chemotaxis protein [Sulfurimonas sp.]|nr:methyl-accepting chemotaxis protein [Sulfurimonas sp.]
MKMNLGVKISMGFISLLVIVAILGLMAIFNMSNVKTVLTRVADVNIPRVQIATGAERHSIHMIDDINAYLLSENKNYMTSGLNHLEKLKISLDEAKDHAQKYSISTLAKSESEIRKLVLEYEKSVNHSIGYIEKFHDERVAMDVAANNFMKNYYSYLDDQNKAYSREIDKGASKTTFHDELKKITLINNIVSFGNDARVNNFKFQSLNDIKYNEMALSNFVKIEETIAQIRKITQQESNIHTLNTIQEMSREYEKSIKDYASNWKELRGEVAKLLSIGEQIVSLAQSSSNEGTIENIEISNISIETLSTAIDTMLIGLVIALIVGIILASIITRNIALPAISMAKTARAIASGDIIQEVTFVSDDELGELADSFRGIVSYLSDASQIAHAIGQGELDVEIKKRSDKDVLGKALENMAANLKKIMSELTESTSVLNSAASEILATTSQIASSASQTSSSVAETTSSVEEIKQTAKLTNEKAVHTAESTKKAVIISDEGNSSLDKNVEGLAQIKEKMNLIAANIIRLSEQSQMIGNIVSTVEDIASQSNLLAVNASIEAVKAGEHGKGFSVVAQELKNLANQSKQGTGEVQKILTDIQQATNTLVMVAEQGGKAVDEGVMQAANARKSMQSLRQSVIEAAQSGTLIAASSEQEMAGMDQIASAMMGIRDATSQNVESIRQVENSAKDLNNLSQKLKSLMEQYSFGGKIG